MFAKTNIKIERIFIGQYVKYSRALYRRTASRNERARKIEDSWEFGVLMLCFYCSLRFDPAGGLVFFCLYKKWLVTIELWEFDKSKAIDRSDRPWLCAYVLRISCIIPYSAFKFYEHFDTLNNSRTPMFVFFWLHRMPIRIIFQFTSSWMFQSASQRVKS